MDRSPSHVGIRSPSVRLVRRTSTVAALVLVGTILAGCRTPAGAREHSLCCPCPTPCEAPAEPPCAPQHPQDLFEHHYGPDGVSLAGVPHTVVGPEFNRTSYVASARIHLEKPNFYAGGGLSLFPNIGASIHAGYVVKRFSKFELAAEAEGIWQFLDDETFADDENDAAGNWYQLKLGGLARFAPEARRHLTTRAGFTWFQANGVPNMVEKPGDYYGGYVGVGFETDLTPNLTIGPEFTLLVTKGPDTWNDGVVPQLGWKLTWRPCTGYLHAQRPMPPGEIYGGIAALVSPALGGAFEFGQVFRRDGTAVWSFELQAGAQVLDDYMWSHGDGDWAQLRGGFKASFSPRCKGHLTGRLGMAWVRSTGETEFLSKPEDYYGAYVGVGYEYDLNPHLTTGPELTFLLMSVEKTFDIEVVPQFQWHFIVKL